MATDTLLFRDAEDTSAGQQTFGWGGPWPPPEFLTLIIGAETGQTAVCEVTPENAVTIHELEARGSKVVNYRRNRASEIADPAPEDEHWFRGAEYLPVKS